LDKNEALSESPSQPHSSPVTKLMLPPDPRPPSPAPDPLLSAAANVVAAAALGSDGATTHAADLHAPPDDICAVCFASGAGANTCYMCGSTVHGPMMGCSVESSLAMHVVCKPCNVDAADAHLSSSLRATIATFAANADLCARAAKPASSHAKKKKTKDPAPLTPKPAAATTCATCNTPAIGHDYCVGCMRCSSCAHNPLTGAKVNLKDLQADGSSRYVECTECDDAAEFPAVALPLLFVPLAPVIFA
jgi:hypothetical protein